MRWGDDAAAFAGMRVTKMSPKEEVDAILFEK